MYSILHFLIGCWHNKGGLIPPFLILPVEFIYLQYMKYLLTIILTGLITGASAQQEIKIEDVRKHIGDSVKICSKVYDTKYLESLKGSPTFLNVGAAYPNELLMILIWSDTRKQFKKPLEEYYKGAQICVTGRVQMYNQIPEIIIYSSKQIQEVIMDQIPDTEPK
jgi:hypothetical protein